LFDRLQGARAYRAALRHPELEPPEEACQTSRSARADIALAPHPEWLSARAAPHGAPIIGGGQKLKAIKGMGTVYDWRDSPWTPVNGGKINPLVFVHHIPVVPNKAGIGDFVTLRNVLVAQGLMVQSSTDAEGNVALFTPFDSLCFQARGANQLSCGCEHMHMTTGEAWTKRQLRAAAWVVQLAQDKHGIPRPRAKLGDGAGVVRVLKRGQTTHEAVSDAAGFHDRSDPGPGFDFEYVDHCIDFWNEHHHFDGA
jgi:hypothetical protein